jgi:2-amino-4-hydroxy-6-hydroxymethyldihydropteridine diphosphokinase
VLRRRAYIGFGANLGDPPAQLSAAARALASLPGVRLVVASRLYCSAPLGPPPQPDYCNAVAAFDVSLKVDALLRHMRRIEAAAGRGRRHPRWSARTLDLDLLHVEGLHSDIARLRLPHPEIGQRNFVLVPLAEVAPRLRIPGLGRCDRLARRVGCAGLTPWGDGAARLF